jgi:hypothetical protein
MTFGAQKIAKALGDSGCYFLSLMQVAEGISSAYLGPIHEAAEAIENGTLGPDCFVKDASAIMSSLTRQRFEVVKAGPGHSLPLDYILATGEREILRFERADPAGGEPIAHFVVGDGSGKVAWDPWPNSQTVALGALISRRIIRRKA